MKAIRKVRNIETIIVLVVVMTFQMACAGSVATIPYVPPQIVDGEIMLLHPGATWQGMMQAAKGAAGTLRYIKDGYTLFAWIQDGNAAYAIIEGSSPLSFSNFLWQWGGKGMMMNGKDFAYLVEQMKKQGWQYVPASAIPTAFTMALEGAVDAFKLVSRGMPNVIILPAGLFDKPAMLTPDPKWQ